MVSSTCERKSPDLAGENNKLCLVLVQEQDTFSEPAERERKPLMSFTAQPTVDVRASVKRISSPWRLATHVPCGLWSLRPCQNGPASRRHIPFVIQALEALD